jgi:hypothetical protein
MGDSDKLPHDSRPDFVEQPPREIPIEGAFAEVSAHAYRADLVCVPRCDCEQVVNDKLSQRERTLYALQTMHSMVTEGINAVQNNPPNCARIEELFDALKHGINIHAIIVQDQARLADPWRS